LCYCCQQSVCLQHLKEHNDLLISQLNPLVDQINSISDRLKAINIRNKVDTCRQKLEQWRNDCHKKIDDFFEQQYQKINRLVTEKVEKQREEIDQIQSKIATLMREEEVSRQDIDLLISSIRKLNQQVNKFEYTHFNIEARPLMIDKSWIHFEESNINRLDLSKISPVCKTINYTDKSRMAFASSDQFIMMHHSPDLCLIDRNLDIIRRTIWCYGDIQEMCWSSSLDRFIIVSAEGVFLLDETTMSIEKLKIVQEREWVCCTCSDTSLFLSTYELASSVMEYTLLPTIEFVKEWKSPVTCRKEEWINDIKYNRGSIALVIKNSSEKTLFIELRNSKTFERLWSFKMDCIDVLKIAFKCCLVNDEEWLVMDRDSDNLVHITKDGKMQLSHTYKQSPCCAAILGPNILAISILKGVNFHKF
jgi:hypothetical protein